MLVIQQGRVEVSLFPLVRPSHGSAVRIIWQPEDHTVTQAGVQYFFLTVVVCDLTVTVFPVFDFRVV